MGESEKLRDIIVYLEQSKARENELRTESEYLLEGLAALNRSHDESGLKSEIISILKKVLLFDDAIILSEKDNEGYTAELSTVEPLSGSRWVSGQLFKRLMNGTPVAVFNVWDVEEWKQFHAQYEERITSALHIPVISGGRNSIVICTHRERGFFTVRHVNIAKRFALLVSQVLVNIEYQKAILDRNRFFTLSLELMCIITYDGFVVQHNSMWGTHLGYSDEDIKGRSFLEFVHPEDVMQSAETFSKIRTSGTSLKFENRMYCRDRSVRHFLWSCSSFAAGAVFYAVGTDITERKEAERVMRERNEMIEKDLKMAQIIQNALVSSSVPLFKNLQVDYRYFPLDAVGGDFFSFTMLADGGLGVFIGDVSGHGIMAALYLSLLKFSTDQMCRMHPRSPKEYLEHLNRNLYGNMPNAFVTAVYGLFYEAHDSGGMHFRFSRSGHPVPVICKSSGKEPSFIDSRGGLMGMIEEIHVEEKEIVLDKGDRLFLYTDGVSECRNRKGRMLSENEFLEMIRDSQSPTLSATMDSIIERVNSYQSSNMIDDMVLIGFEVT